MSLPAISQHLQVLCDVELVSPQRATATLNCNPSSKYRLGSQYEYFGLANSVRWAVLGGTPMKNCNIGSLLPSPERVWQALIDRRAWRLG